jgi:hypothetical protein
MQGFLSAWTATVSGTVSIAAYSITIRHYPVTIPLKLAHYTLTCRDGSVA